MRWLTARRSLVVHLVYSDDYTVCGRRPELADVDEGGSTCGNCLRIATAQALTIPERKAPAHA